MALHQCDHCELSFRSVEEKQQHEKTAHGTGKERFEAMIEKEKYLRLAADFENYRKHMEKELIDVARFGNQKILTSVMDELDKAQDYLRRHPDPKKSDDSDYLVRVLDAEFRKILNQFGVEAVEAVGMPFDPATMEAVAMVDGGESQQVKEEVRAGYTMHGRVIRPARVIIYQ